MNKKDTKTLDKLIGELSASSHRIFKIREAVGINPTLSFTREAETIEYLFASVLKLRKELKNTVICSSTSGWTVNYIRQHKKYKENENYSTNIHFSFVEADTYE